LYGSLVLYFLVAAFFEAAALVVLVDALVDRVFDEARALLAVRPRALVFGLSTALAGVAILLGLATFAGVDANAGVTAFLAGVTALLATLDTAFEGVVALTAAVFTGLADRARGGEATASAAFLAAALFGFGSDLVTAVATSAFLVAAFFFAGPDFLASGSSTTEASCFCACALLAVRCLTISVLQ
jgi:hypothetical protein